MSRTRIVCTIGPASCSCEVVRGLIRAGMNVARINFSHGDHATHRRSIATVRRVAREEGRLVAVMADLQGPKLRVGEIPNGGIELREGEIVTLTVAADPDRTGGIPVPHPELIGALRTGDIVLLDDGGLELVVVEEGASRVRARVVTGGRLLSRKGINVPLTDIQVTALTPKDREDVAFAVDQQVDFFALSFVRRAADIQDLRKVLAQHDADAPIIAKIEKPEALSVFDDILAESDGIMVARGDLGVETPAEEVPFHQKHIIRACNRTGTPVITATQMLQSMIENPRPTRAEASDVANAILDGTDAVMLSGETAVGRFPVEATATMASICANAEAHLVNSGLPPLASAGSQSVTAAISDAAADIASQVGARVIVTATMSGTTARMVARHRPPIPILAVTPSEATLRHLTLVWGVTPVLVAQFDDTDGMVQAMVRAAREERLASAGDQIVLTAGIPFGSARGTNMLKVHVVGGAEAT